MLELLYEKLKELEKIAPKEKGITSMSVKEVVQSLVDDALVDTEKIGTSIYFWSFPSKAFQARKNKINQLQNEANQTEVETNQILEEIDDLKVGKEITDEREELLAKHTELVNELAELDGKLDNYDNCDPHTIENLKSNTRSLVDATNRWTDNIYSIVSFCKNKLSLEEKEVYKFFGLPEEFDYIA